MAVNAADMVDNVVEGASSSEANLTFSLTKDNLEKIKNTFKPTSSEDNLFFEFQSSGRITVSMNDNGVTVWTHISTTEMDLNGEDYQSFYLDKGRVSKLTEVCSGQITFSVAEGQMEAKIGTTDLHISLPMYEASIDIDFNENTSESKASEDVSILCQRCMASKGSGSFMLAVMSLKDKWYYGNTQSVSIVENGFSNLELNIAPLFLDYISNLTFTKDEIKFIVDEDTNQVIVTSDNVFYKTNLQPVEFDDVEGLFEEEVTCSITLDTPETVAKLGILSIPLMGQDNAIFTIDADEDGDSNVLGISVKDESNRISTDKWNIKESKGDLDSTSLGINSYIQTVKAISQEDVYVEFRESSVIISDQGQKTILLKFI